MIDHGDEAGPVVAVIVPVYKVEDYVVPALESVCAQQYRHWECIVVDDGSPDSSAERAMTVIARDQRMRLVRQENRGLSGARNTGLAHLSPSVRFVAFLDSDDLWLPTTLQDLLNALEADPAAVGSYGYAELCDSTGAPLDPGRHPAAQRNRRRINGWRLESVPAQEPMTFDEAVVVSPLYPPAVGLHRRWAVDEVGSFDIGLRQLEDWDYYQRMVRHGHYVVAQQQVAWYRRHGGQMTRDQSELFLHYAIVRRKVWESPQNSPPQRRAATRAWRQLQVRRTGRAVLRLVRTVRGGRWREMPSLLAGTMILAAQNLAAGPPRVTPRQLQLARWGL